ncbi:ESX secretion-associated protein EspG [Nocardia neocaledoniensis]|uniref:ESX secretion-associated protein EspG n=1 Tax=Nocardia neocaledoniensis TaxID=236511 RepID=UPI002456AC26|nr:ESX secretion-associated protein EspG [Nocardia neocaledoniensis]
MNEWVWEPDDFAALWYSEGIDRFPRPLHLLSKFRTAEEYEANRARVRATLGQDELIRLALHTLTFGQFRIEIKGGSIATDQGDLREYRVVGAQHYEHAVVLAQATVDDVDGPIHARLFPAAQLPQRLSARVPKCGPGSHPILTLPTADLQSPPAPRSYAQRTPREQFEALTRRPIDGSGQARLFVGHILDRPAPWFSTQWIDVTADGRYLQIRTPDRITVRPATPADLTTGFTGWIDRTHRRLRQAETADW